MSSCSYNIGEYTFEVFNNPKESISKPYQEYLTSKCTELSKSGFGNPNIESKDVRPRILDTSTTIFSKDQSGNLIGFSSNSLKKINDFYIIYLQSGVIDKKYNGKGLHKILICMRIIEEVKKLKEMQRDLSDDCILVSGRTQNPLVYRTFHRKLGLYPNPNGSCDERMQDVAEKLARELYDAEASSSQDTFLFDREHFVFKKAYKSMSGAQEVGVNLYHSNVPFCQQDDEINDYMKHHLDWQNGDGLMTIGPYCSERVGQLYEQAEQQISYGLTRAA